MYNILLGCSQSWQILEEMLGALGFDCNKHEKSNIFYITRFARNVMKWDFLKWFSYTVNWWFLYCNALEYEQILHFSVISHVMSEKKEIGWTSTSPRD